MKKQTKSDKLKERPSEDIWQEWLDDWGGLQKMADHYEIDKYELWQILEDGRKKNKSI